MKSSEREANEAVIEHFKETLKEKCCLKRTVLPIVYIDYIFSVSVNYIVTVSHALTKFLFSLCFRVDGGLIFSSLYFSNRVFLPGY